MEVTPADLPDLSDLKRIVAATQYPKIRLFISHLSNDSIERTLAIAESAATENLQPVPHIVARRYKNIAQITQTLYQFHACADIREILILGGDAPIPAGKIHSSLDLLRSDAFRFTLFEIGIRRLWFGIHPEGHPTINSAALQSALEEKCAYSAKTKLPVRFITQMTFTAKPLLHWLNTLPSTMPHIHPSVFADGQYASLARLARLTQTPSARQFLQNTVGSTVSYHPQLYRIATVERSLGGLHFLSLGKFAETLEFAVRLRQGKFRIDDQNLYIMTA